VWLRIRFLKEFYQLARLSVNLHFCCLWRYPPQKPLFFMCFSGIRSLRISDEISNEFGEIKESKFTAGNVIFVPANEKHQSKNNSEKTVKLLCLTPVHK
jgi:hypothetical protein